MPLKRILITGADGFIGQHLYKKLKTLKHYDVAGVSLRGGEVGGGKISQLDIIDQKAVENFFNGKQFDIVFHLAAIRGGGYSDLESARSCVLTNGLGTLNILEQIRKQKNCKIVYFSTIEVYGRRNKITSITEDDVPEPATFYGIGKLLGEYSCRKYFFDFKVPYVCLRLASVYGLGQISNSISAIFIERAKANKEIIVYGKGNGCVDLVFVEDAVNAAILAAASLKIGIFNIGSNSTNKVKDIAKTIKKIWASPSEIIFDKAKNEQCCNIKLNIQKAKKELGYSPRYSLKAGLSKLKNQAEL